MVKNVDQSFPKPKTMSENVLLCPQPKDNQFTVIEEEAFQLLRSWNERIFTFCFLKKYSNQLIDDQNSWWCNLKVCPQLYCFDSLLQVSSQLCPVKRFRSTLSSRQWKANRVSNLLWCPEVAKKSIIASLRYGKTQACIDCRLFNWLLLSTTSNLCCF